MTRFLMAATQYHMLMWLSGAPIVLTFAKD